MSPDELRLIAHRALALRPSPLQRHHPGARHESREGVALNAWGMPGPSSNKAAVFGPAPPLDRVLALASEFFGDIAFGVMVEADAGHPVEAELRSRGWSVVEDEPAMVLPELPAAPPLPPGLEVRPVTDADSRRDFITALIAGFSAPTAEGLAEVPPAEELDALGPSLAAVLDPDIALVLGLADGRPVATALMHRVEEIAVIAGVATAPASRRRGFGTALTWAALAEGAARGCTRGALNGLGASYPMYLGMGFRHVCNHRTYAPPAA
jgi:GNAT superfamily N-acetyltransferase